MKSGIRRIIKSLANVPVIRVPILFLHRLVVVFGYYRRHFRQVFKWLFLSKENTNFTYELSEANVNYLAAFVSHISGKPFAEIRSYIAELEQDEWLIKHVQNKIQGSGKRHLADENVWFCRRLGWYAFVRALKPRITVETGVDKGLGSCVIARALEKNSEEGCAGYYYGTDINPQAGYLFAGRLSAYGKILYGDSLESLRKLPDTIDLFINDSDHSASYECSEYEQILQKLSPRGVVLGDNAHVTAELFKFSTKHGRSFLFFREEPRDHWYPGAGIGASFVSPRV